MAIIDSTTKNALPSSGCACGDAARAPSSAGFAARVRSEGASASRHLSLVPAVLLVLLPKCPLCVAAYLGVFGSLGAGSWVRAAWGPPLGAGLLAFTLGALALRARRSRDIRPLLLGLAGAATLLAGKFALDLPPLVYAGAALLLGASLWSAPRRSVRLEPTHDAAAIGSPTRP